MRTLLQKLVEINAPAGHEGTIRQTISAEVAAYADETRIDHLGNLIVRKGEAAAGSARIMLAAHMDEIGVIATHIDENGFVRFIPIGGVYPRNCLGARIRFLNGLAGVIGLERSKEADKIPPFEQMFIDLGFSNRKACPIQIGDVAAFERPFVEMGKRLTAKAMDDRAGVAVLLETLRQISQPQVQLPNQVFFVFSVQEEVGERGATVAAYDLNPDCGLAVDITSCGDTPRGIKMEVNLGKGPAIKVRDSGMLSDPHLGRSLVNVAEKAHLPYQLEVLEHGSTDAKAIQLSRAGVPASCISIPCRYVHSQSEMVDMDDLQNAVLLLSAFLRQPIELKE
jgi:putative aminopeptidase FrvX